MSAGRRTYRCGICKAEFATKAELNFHLQLGHLK